MGDIIDNYKSGGAVRELVNYYNQCVANACTLSKKYVFQCSRNSKKANRM